MPSSPPQVNHTGLAGALVVNYFFLATAFFGALLASAFLAGAALAGAAFLVAIGVWVPPFLSRGHGRLVGRADVGNDSRLPGEPRARAGTGRSWAGKPIARSTPVTYTRPPGVNPFF